MKIAAFCIALATLASSASGAVGVDAFDLFAPTQASPHWRPNEAVWKNLAPRTEPPPVTLGGTPLQLRGPLVIELRRAAPGGNAGLGRRLMAVPAALLSLAVPQPMPVPPESGVPYFAWGERDTAWSATVGAGATGPGGLLSISAKSR